MVEWVSVDQESIFLTWFPHPAVCTHVLLLVWLNVHYSVFYFMFLAEACSYLWWCLLMQCIPEDEDTDSIHSSARRYYLIPCFFLFDRNHMLLNLVLKMLGSIVPSNGDQNATNPSSMVGAIVSVILLMHKDVRIQQIISSFKADVDSILQNIICLQVRSCTI